MSDTQQRNQPQPAQRQEHQPGRQTHMATEPASIRDDYRGSGKLGGRVVVKFGADNLVKRPAQSCEVAPAYVFLASDDASYINRQFIHVNGGAYMH